MIINLNEETRAFYLELILKCDPCVGDTSCQIRAIILLDFYTTLCHSSLFEKLNPEEKNQIAQFIEDAIFLTTYSDTKIFEPALNRVLNKIPLDVFLQLKQNPKLTDILKDVNADNYQTHLFTHKAFSTIKNVITETKTLKSHDEKVEFSELDTNQESVVFLNQYLRLNECEPLQKVNRLKCLFMEKKQYLANHGFKHLQNIAREMHFSEKYQKYLDTPFLLYNFFTKQSRKEKIQMIPAFISTSIMLYQLKKTAGILALNLRVNEISEPIVLYYQFQKDQFKVTPDLNPNVAIYINMDIERKNAISPHVEACFGQMDIEQFLNDFKAIAIEKLILMCAAAHAPVPAKIKIENQAVFQEDFPDIPMSNCPTLSNTHINLDECLYENYAHLNTLAKFYGLSHDMKINQLPIVNIRHIHIGSTPKHNHLPQTENHLNQLMSYTRR